MDLEGGWKLTVSCKNKKKKFTLSQLKEMGPQNYTADFHCVTSWSALDLKWTGISLKKIIEACKDIISDDWNFLIQKSKDDYTTNSPRKHVERDDVFLAYEYEGKPISKDHGIVRIIIPHLYAWKSAKFLKAIEFSVTDKPGYWEVKGYSNIGEVWKDDRFN